MRASGLLPRQQGGRSVTRHTSSRRAETNTAKTTSTYWNPLAAEQKYRWTPLTGLEGMAKEITLSHDPASGEYTRLTRFLPGADTSVLGIKTHAHPEELFVVSGRLYDEAFGGAAIRPG